MYAGSKMIVPYMTLEQFRALLKQHDLLDNIPLQRALQVAISAFEGLRRDDGSDVLTQHLLPMTASLVEYYVLEKRRIDVDLLIASLLHDVGEDVKGFNLQEIRQIFGDKVYEISSTLTKHKLPKRVGYYIYENRLKYNKDYYAQINSSSKDVKLIKAADRLNNLKCAYTNPDSNKVLNYIRETEEIYLPIFSEFPYFYKRIYQELIRLRKYQDSLSLPEQKEQKRSM